MFWTVALTAQNTTNSPYTRYGYGDLGNRSFGAGRSMGGVSVGLRTSNQINPMNPASYTSIDSMTFLFDFGATFQASFYNDKVNKQTNLNGNVDYMAMEFPIFKRAAMSVGLTPFSHVGYQYGNTKMSTDGLYYRETFEGIGGLNQLYAGLSIEIWKKRLSIGSNINYLFGAISHVSKTEYYSTNSTAISGSTVYKLNDVLFDFGLQYVQPLTRNDKLVVGLTYAPGKQLKSEMYKTIASSSSTSTEILLDDTIKDRRSDYPNSYGAGISFIRANKFMIAVDFSLQEWSKASFNGEADKFNDRSKISAGVEIIPNLYSRPYLNHVKYRGGLSYTNSYIKVNRYGYGYDEYIATLGAGFPISDGRSFVNVALEYVKVKPDIKTMINENYFKLTLSYTFNEFWFFKRKVD
jgi:hypothetical protein